MGAANKDGEFETKELPIVGQYNVQRFLQFSPEDAANWYVVKGRNTKKPNAMYPVMGRAHINFLGTNQLIFGSEPRGEFKSIQYAYIVVGNSIIRVDSNYNTVNISGDKVTTFAGPMYFCFLVVNSIVFSCFVDAEHIYIYQENTENFQVVTDPNAPGNVTVDGIKTTPGFIAAFGNRITVSVANSSQFFLSEINLIDPTTGAFNPATCFTINGAPIFAQENGIIRQMGVLTQTLYIFTDYTTGVWSNIQAVFSGTQLTFPWKKNTTYDWNFGIANPSSLDIDFGKMVFLARNSDGLLQFMHSTGDQPKVISTKAIDTLLQRYNNAYGANNPFLQLNSNGFLYQYENTIFYRMSGGNYTGTGILDQELTGDSIEYNFEIEDWHRCIELNGERNRIQYHVYFNFKHLVTVIGDNTVYDMSGQYYFNEITNPDQPDRQADDAYIAYPFRYERVTPIISEEDYSEFETEYVEIDFVFGESNISFSTAPFTNTVFIIDEQTDSSGNPQYVIDEQPDADGQPVFMITEDSNFPGIGELTYNALYKPNITLYYSDDGGVSFNSADNRQFSDQGVYIWKVRWYQLGPSRNRVYKLVCVSPVPIVVLGGSMNVRRISGGAN